MSKPQHPAQHKPPSVTTQQEVLKMNVGSIELLTVHDVATGFARSLYEAGLRDVSVTTLGYRLDDFAQQARAGLYGPNVQAVAAKAFPLISENIPRFDARTADQEFKNMLGFWQVRAQIFQNSHAIADARFQAADKELRELREFKKQNEEAMKLLGDVLIQDAIEERNISEEGTLAMLRRRGINSAVADEILDHAVQMLNEAQREPSEAEQDDATMKD